MSNGNVCVQSYLVINKEFHFVCERVGERKVIREDELLSVYTGIVIHKGNKVMRADGSEINRKNTVQLDNGCGMKKFLIDDDAFATVHGGTSKGQASKAKVDRLTVRAFNADDLVHDVWEERHQIGKREIVDYLGNLLKKTGGIQK